MENLKDRIIAAFNAHTGLDEGARKMWCGDTKEMYYTVVSIDGLLSHSGNAELARSQLFAACSRFEQVRSELLAVGETELEEELARIFRECHDQLSARVPAIPPAAITPPRTIKQSPENYELPCSVCGKTAVSVHLAGAEEKILQGVICAGISRSVGLNLKDKERIFGWLTAEDLASLHNYMEVDCDIEGGLDAWCPACGRVYCRTHYNVKEVWDEGFYDSATATCPNGHSRKIDD
jgi:hypothetical protein